MDVGVALAMQNPNRQQADHQVYWVRKENARGFASSCSNLPLL